MGIHYLPGMGILVNRNLQKCKKTVQTDDLYKKVTFNVIIDVKYNE